MVNGWTFFVQRLLPPVCVLCGDRGQPPELDLCRSCAGDLPANTSACPRCGEPLAGLAGAAAPLCGACLKKRPRYDATFCAWRYAYPVDHLVRALKYDGAIGLSRVLAGLLVSALKAGRECPWPDCIVPMPLHAARFRARGYNQSIELGLIVARELNVPLRTDLVERVHATREQAALSRKERRRNVRGAFTVIARSPARIAVLDDVITTGSTMNEIARVLKRAGAVYVEAWALARAV